MDEHDLKSHSLYLSLKKKRENDLSVRSRPGSFPKIDESVMDFVDKRPVFIPAVQFWRRRREGAKSADEKSPSNWRCSGQSNRQSITAPGTYSSSATSSDSLTCYTQLRRGQVLIWFLFIPGRLKRIDFQFSHDRGWKFTGFIFKFQSRALRDGGLCFSLEFSCKEVDLLRVSMIVQS